MASIARDGWTLLSAEERNAAHPESFTIPDRASREAIEPGDAAQLLFDIETRESGVVIDRGVDRMWVIVKSRTGARYLGTLDSDPGVAENLRLRPGDTIEFGPEHIIAIARPPREYELEK